MCNVHNHNIDLIEVARATFGGPVFEEGTMVVFPEDKMEIKRIHDKREEERRKEEQRLVILAEEQRQEALLGLPFGD